MSIAYSTGNTNQQHIPGHRNCPACDGALDMLPSDLNASMSFSEAFEVWIAQRVIHESGPWAKARYISQRTERDLRQYARAAARFFQTLQLGEIHAGHLRAYQTARALNLLRIDGADVQPWEQRAGANLIRKEVGTVVRVMKAAGVWTQQLGECYERVQPVENDVPRAMTPDEQHRWMHVAASRPEWQLIYQWSIMALQTTAATNELRALRLGDIFLENGTLQIRNEGAKNKFRVRTIPFQSPEIVWALGGLIDRAKRLGANGPHCYLFPLHITADRYDPLQPMTVWGIRKPWEAVREAAGLAWLRPYDLRHTAITRLAEAGAPAAVIMSYAGHVSMRMLQHYTAISMQAKRRWGAMAWGPEAALPPKIGPHSTVPEWHAPLAQGLR